MAGVSGPCANQAWNLSTAAWNKQPARRRAGPGKRSRDIQTMPPVARFLPLHGEVRPHYDPRSTLFNTDGQGFSDIGVRWCCSWRITTSTASAITTRTTT